MFACLVLLVLASGPAVAGAQETDGPGGDGRAEMGSAADTESVARLRAHLRENPDDVVGLRLLASTLHRMGDRHAASRAYEVALAARPDDAHLRLAFGRMLLELREGGRAREVLRPVAEDPSAPPDVRAGALVALGREGLRTGRTRAAEEDLVRSLDLGEGGREARRLLEAVRRERAHWLRAEATGEYDDQPLNRSGADVRGGLHLADGVETEFRAVAEDLRAGSVGDRIISARALVRGRWDPLGVEGEIWGGGFRRSAVDEGDWSGGVSLVYSGPGGVTLRAHGLRMPYLRTVASLETPVTPTVVGGSLERGDGWRWGGAIYYEKERFQDGTRTEEAGARILAPLAVGPDAALRAGYGFRTADSDRNGFVAILPVAPTGGVALPGRYAPIYTPQEVREHSLLLDARYEPDERASVAFEGAWGFRAREHEPMLFAAVPGAPEAGVHLQFQPRDFTPWRAGVRGRAPLTAQFVLEVDASYRSGAFRDVSNLRVGGIFYGLPDVLP